MNRRHWIAGMAGLAALAGLPLSRAADAAFPLQKSRKAWAALLPPASYRVLFEEATEAPGSSPLNDEKRAGTFVCAACFLPLFSSASKYDSGTGWPSFWQPLPDAVGDVARASGGDAARPPGGEVRGSERPRRS